MDTVDLKEYLGIVVDMEKNIYFQNKLLSSLQRKIDQLKIPLKIPEPEKEPVPPRPYVAETLHINMDILYGIAVFFIFGFIGDIGYKIMGSATENILLDFIQSLGIFAAIGIFIYDYRHTLENNSKSQQQYDVAHSKYLSDYEKYQKAIKSTALAQLLDREFRERQTAIYHAECLRISDALEQSKECLNKIYAQNIIFPKYRNLVMVCSLYEYICAGRCTSLEGHEGAYNILEMEIRLDKIITQLDKIISQLNTIQNNQFMLYSSIQESNRQSAQILESTQRMADQLQGLGTHLDSQSAEFQAQLADLQKSSALTAYQAERAQKELHYMNRMNYLSGKYDDVFFNLPPN